MYIQAFETFGATRLGRRRPPFPTTRSGFASTLTLNRAAIPAAMCNEAKVPLEDRMALNHICDIRDLAIAFLEKCAVDPYADLHSGGNGQPSRVTPIFRVSRTNRSRPNSMDAHHYPNLQ